MMKPFVGSKGGSSTSFRQTPDNLRSNDTFEGVLGMGIGPMLGPTKGLKSVKLDGTAVENATGELNFGDFIVNLGDGDPLKWPQTITLKLGAGAAPTNVGLSLTNPNAGSPGPWVVKTLNNVNADYIDMRFIVNQLFRQDKSGVYDSTATIEIQMKPVGKTNWIAPNLGTPAGTYNQLGTTNGIIRTLIPEEYFEDNGSWSPPSSSGYSVTGKTQSPSVYELRIAVPNEGAYAGVAWDVRARLVERDSYEADPNIEKRTITWESIAAVYAGTLGTHEDWRGVAWMQLYGKASDQLTGVPEITGEWDTKIVSVPPSPLYNPGTRQYTNGTWDGSFSKAFTTDPAWLINDAITDSLSGLSLIAPGSFLNKWDALEASKWFSVLVPDGNGGTEPRYSMNLAINQPQKAEEFIRYLAGAVGALAWDEGNGEWRIKCDKPEIPADIFTLDNIEGEFIYSHTDVDTRYNDITFAFKNKEMDYREDRVRLYNNPSIAAIGRKPTTIVGVGCTGRQEAMRRAKLRLESTTGETRIVNFTTNRRGRNIEHLDTILVADGDLGEQSKRTTGRVVSISADRKTVVVRDAMYLAQNVTYNLTFAALNASYNPSPNSEPEANWKKPTFATSFTVTNSNGERGAVQTIRLNQALPLGLDEYPVVALSAPNLPTVPKLYRVTNVAVNDDGERISISALEVNVNKWNLSDNVSKSDTIFQDLRGAVPPPGLPIDGEIFKLIVTQGDEGKIATLFASWVRPTGAFISGFKIGYSVNDGPVQIAVEQTQDTTFEIVNPPPGTYRIFIQTMDRRGGLSTPLSGSIVITQQMLSQITTWENVSNPLGTKPANNATNSADPTSPFGNITIGSAQQIINKAVADIAAVEGTAAGLLATYGQTAAAGAARDAAEAAKAKALEYRDAAFGFKETASTKAGQASGYAQEASDSKAAAASFALLTSSTGPGVLNRNPNFGAWPDDQPLPTGWFLWGNGGGAAQFQRVAGRDGNPYALRMVSPANSNTGIYQVIQRGFGAYVVEATMTTLNASGAGLFVQLLKADGTEFSSPYSSKKLSLLNKKDTSGWAADAAGNSGNYIRTFSWYIDTPIDGNISQIVIYIMSNWTEFDNNLPAGGGVAAAPMVGKSIDWHTVRIRPATEAEIALHDPISGLGAKASITLAQQVATDAQGNAIAASKQEFDAKFSGVTPTGLSGLIAQRPTYTETAATVSTAVTAAVGPTSSIAQRVSGVEARASTSRQNLVVNGSAEYGMRGIWGSTPGWIPTEASWTWGSAFINYGTNGTNSINWPIFTVQQGETYTISADTLLFADSGSVYVDILYVDANQAVVPGGDSDQRARSATHDFNAGTLGKDLVAVNSVAPPGAVYGIPRFVWAGVTGANVMGVRQLQVERGGGTWTAYNSNQQALAARTSITESALADVNGKLAAYLRLDAIAGTSSAQLVLMAQGGQPSLVYIRGSQIVLDGEVIINDSVRFSKIPNGDLSRKFFVNWGDVLGIPEGDNGGTGGFTIPVAGVGPSGIDITVQFEATRSGTRSFDASAVLFRDGVELPGARVTASTSGYGVPISFFRIDNPGPGNHTYSIVFYVDNSGFGQGGTWSFRNIQAKFEEFNR